MLITGQYFQNLLFQPMNRAYRNSFGRHRYPICSAWSAGQDLYDKIFACMKGFLVSPPVFLGYRLQFGDFIRQLFIFLSGYIIGHIGRTSSVNQPTTDWYTLFAPRFFCPLGSEKWLVKVSFTAFPIRCLSTLKPPTLLRRPAQAFRSGRVPREKGQLFAAPS